LRKATFASTPSVRSSGTSFSASCSCSVRVAVETTTLSPLFAAGNKYASVLPVPVPASTTSARPRASADATWPAISSCAGRAS
jgi:hypothetical protein